MDQFIDKHTKETYSLFYIPPTFPTLEYSKKPYTQPFLKRLSHKNKIFLLLASQSQPSYLSCQSISTFPSCQFWREKKLQIFLSSYLLRFIVEDKVTEWEKTVSARSRTNKESLAEFPLNKQRLFGFSTEKKFWFLYFPLSSKSTKFAWMSTPSHKKRLYGNGKAG